ncbi:hypothetical protein [Piscibacillus halophilus]|uniref:hypothetical protein n=1 Tax=Piscibacillus halophilus TaxID=571933 RepID=UPI000B890854|nr:hypothetical protein [Piscibacillus halophilus]
MVLLTISILLISFYIFFPILLVSVLSENHSLYLPLAWVYVFLIFVLTWGIGLFYAYYMRSIDRKVTMSKQAKD